MNTTTNTNLDEAQNPSPATENKNSVSAGKDLATVSSETLRAAQGDGQPCVKKHPLAIAWDEWLASDEGRVAVQYESLPRNGTAQRYLENRLHRAFDAGAKAHEKELYDALKALYDYQQSISSPDTRWGLPIYERARVALAAVVHNQNEEQP